jgi:hypothetical protein
MIKYLRRAPKIAPDADDMPVLLKNQTASFDVLCGCLTKPRIYGTNIIDRNALPRPVQMLLLMLVGWINRRRLDVLEYLQEENQSV